MINENDLGQDLASDADDNAHMTAAYEAAPEAVTTDPTQADTTAEVDPDVVGLEAALEADSEYTPEDSDELAEGAAVSSPSADESAVVDYKLEQTDDEPREGYAEPLTIAVVRELVRTGGDWWPLFDPQVGMKATSTELAKAIVPVKVYQAVPAMEGGAKGTQKVENGILQYQPKAVNKNFNVSFDEQEVTKAFSGLLSDSLSKYILENFTKPMNKLAENKKYGRKMPLRTFNSGSRVSLNCIAELSGVTLEEFLHDILRAGWFKKSAATQQFELEQMCETTEEVAAVLAGAGKTIAAWKPRDFPHHMGTVAIFKRVGKLVEEGFKFKGRAPTSAAVSTVVDCINTYNQKYEQFFNKVDAHERQVEAGELPAESLPAMLLQRKHDCMVHLGRWNIVVCGLEALAKDLGKKEADKLAKANAAALKAGAAADTDLPDIETGDLDFMTL